MTVYCQACGTPRDRHSLHIPGTTCESCGTVDRFGADPPGDQPMARMHTRSAAAGLTPNDRRFLRVLRISPAGLTGDPITSP